MIFNTCCLKQRRVFIEGNSVCVCQGVCPVRVLQVSDYTFSPWLTNWFFLWCNRHSNTHTWFNRNTHTLTQKIEWSSNDWRIYSSSVLLFMNFTAAPFQSGKLGTVVSASASWVRFSQRVCCSQAARAATVPPRSFITAMDEDAEINWTLVLFPCLLLTGSPSPPPRAQVLHSLPLCLAEASACFPALFFLRCARFLALLCSVSSFSSTVTSFLYPFHLLAKEENGD